MQEAHFTNIKKEIIKCLKDAQARVDIAMAWFTNMELFDELMGLIKKGVTVNLILLDDGINWQEYAPDFNSFVGVGGKLHIAEATDGIMHHKFCIIDDSVLITGSYNWTYYAEHRNRENILITTDLTIVEQYSNEFTKLLHSVPSASCIPRLSWNEISTLESVDFDMLNYEIERISQIRHLPIQRVIKNTPVVQITEVNRNVVAAAEIGIMGVDEKGEQEFIPFIPLNALLPASASNTLYTDGNEELYCDITIKEADGNLRDLKRESVNKIIEGCSKKQNVEVLFTMCLNENGHLCVELVCNDSGKKLSVDYTNSNLKDYAD